MHSLCLCTGLMVCRGGSYGQSWLIIIYVTSPTSDLGKGVLGVVSRVPRL